MAPPTDRSDAALPPAADDQIGHLQEQVRVLAEALRVLASGLEPLPTDEPDNQRGAQAARQAHELLLSARL